MLFNVGILISYISQAFLALLTSIGLAWMFEMINVVGIVFLYLSLKIKPPYYHKKEVKA